MNSFDGSLLRFASGAGIAGTAMIITVFMITLMMAGLILMIYGFF